MLVSSWSEKFLGNLHHGTWERGPGLPSLTDLQSNPGLEGQALVNPSCLHLYDCSLYALRTMEMADSLLKYSQALLFLCVRPCYPLHLEYKAQLSNLPPSVRAQLPVPSPGRHSGKQRLRLCLVPSLPRALSFVYTQFSPL